MSLRSTLSARSSIGSRIFGGDGRMISSMIASEIQSTPMNDCHCCSVERLRWVEEKWNCDCPKSQRDLPGRVSQPARSKAKIDPTATHNSGCRSSARWRWARIGTLKRVYSGNMGRCWWHNPISTSCIGTCREKEWSMEDMNADLCSAMLMLRTWIPCCGTHTCCRLRNISLFSARSPVSDLLGVLSLITSWTHPILFADWLKSPLPCLSVLSVVFRGMDILHEKGLGQYLFSLGNQMMTRFCLNPLQPR